MFNSREEERKEEEKERREEGKRKGEIHEGGKSKNETERIGKVMITGGK